MDKQTIIETIHSIAGTIKKAGGDVRINPIFDDMFSRFIDAVNPQYPTDTVDFIDILNVALTGKALPRPSQIEILKSLLHQGDFTHGDLRWKYRHPVLIAQFSSKHGDMYYEIKFIPVKKIDTKMTGDTPLSFPLLIEVSVYEYLEDDLEDEEIEAEPQLTREHGRLFEGCSEFNTSAGDWLICAHYNNL